MEDRAHLPATASDVPLTAETDLDALFTAILGRDADGGLSRRTASSSTRASTLAPPAPNPAPALRPVEPAAFAEAERSDDAAPAGLDDLTLADVDTRPLFLLGSSLSATPVDEPLAIGGDALVAHDSAPPWRTVASSPWTRVALAAIVVGTLAMIVRSVGRSGETAVAPAVVAAPTNAPADSPSLVAPDTPPITSNAAIAANPSLPSSAAVSRPTPAPIPNAAAPLPPMDAAPPAPVTLGTRVAAGVIVAVPSAPTASGDAQAADVVSSSPPAPPTPAAREPEPLVPADVPAPAAAVVDPTPRAPAVQSEVPPAPPAAATSETPETPAPAAQGAGVSPVPRAVGVTRPARIIERPAISLRSSGPPGEVTVQITVDAAGAVSAVRTLSGPMALRPAAEAAARQTRFEPALRAGVPVASLVTVVYAISPR